ncbi:MAG: hypothetical protein ABIP28_13750, partial [Mucilaginibacter sp.]
MNITKLIGEAPAGRQKFLTVLHEAIIANDPTVIPVVKPMMGKEMIFVRGALLYEIWTGQYKKLYVA